MSKSEMLGAKLGGNIAASLGVRGERAEDTPAGGAAPQKVLSTEGLTRNRAAGEMEIDRIMPDPSQPRQEFDDESLGRLAESLHTHGQLQPIRVRWRQDLGKWIIITGERRWRAAKKAGLVKISCVFIDRELTEAEILTEQAVENLHRSELSEIEEAQAFASLQKLNSWTGKQVAEFLRLSESKVSKALKLLKLPEDIQAEVNQGTIPLSQAYEIAKVKDEQAQRKLAADVKETNLSREETARRVRTQQHKAQKAGKRSRATTEEVFKTPGGLKVMVRGNRKSSGEEVEAALNSALEQVRSRRHEQAA